MLKTNSLFTASSLESLRVGLKPDLSTKYENKIGPICATTQKPVTSYYS